MHMTGKAPASAHHKINLFMEYACGEVVDVPDPYYGRTEDFEAVYDMIARGVEAVLDKVAGAGKSGVPGKI